MKSKFMMFVLLHLSAQNIVAMDGQISLSDAIALKISMMHDLPKKNEIFDELVRQAYKNNSLEADFNEEACSWEYFTTCVFATFSNAILSASIKNSKEDFDINELMPAIMPIIDVHEETILNNLLMVEDAMFIAMDKYDQVDDTVTQ